MEIAEKKNNGIKENVEKIPAKQWCRNKLGRHLQQ